MTSLNAPGVSITLLRIPTTSSDSFDILDLLDQSTSAPGWPKVSLGLEDFNTEPVIPDSSLKLTELSDKGNYYLINIDRDG